MSSKVRKIKVNKNAKKQESVVSNNELKNLLKIILIVCGVLLVFYFITTLVQNKDNNSNNNSDTATVIQYNKILVGEILNRNESEYYVLVEEEKDSYIELYKQYLDNIEGSVYYTVDLSDIFNQNNIGEEMVVEGNDVSKYKFSETTLLKVINGELKETYKGQSEITEYLKKL